ncbi:MAG: hypothetical protein WBA06_10855 [Candidatus Aquilonibacter sp.]
MRKALLFTLITFAVAPALSIAAAQRDVATIRNSGSTNTAGFTITVWSDATGSASVQAATPKAFGVPNDLSARFFADLRAASSAVAPATHCMKSASFGTSTIVQWHGWSSPDLQCRPFSASLGALANDINAIETAAGITTQLHRGIRLPPDVRKIPTTIPEVQPT